MPEDIERFLACDVTNRRSKTRQLPFRRRSLRIVVSDFLFPHDAEALVSRLARDSALLAIVQLTLQRRGGAGRRRRRGGWSTSRGTASSTS